MVVNQDSWEEPVSESRSQGKSFDISKQLIWEAYLRVKANKGAAGVDGVTIEQFDQDVKNNLYRLWNRMSSGSYFPPPVKAVEIPKATVTGRGVQRWTRLRYAGSGVGGMTG